MSTDPKKANSGEALDARLTTIRAQGSPRGDLNEILGACADPFWQLYEAKASDAGHRVAAAEAHDVEGWRALRKAERQAATALRESAEREYLAKREAADPSDKDFQVLAREVVERQHREDAAYASIVRAAGAKPEPPPSGGTYVSQALEVEDDRAGVVEIVAKNLILEPSYHPAVLELLVQHNSSLLPLVQAMEINVAGTGWEVVADETQAAGDDADEEGDDAIQRQVDALSAFFREPWPGESWTTIRRKMRVDLHSGGNAYLEVLRDEAGAVAMARPVDHKLVRLVRLDEPTLAEKVVVRGGREVKVKVWVRERRYAQQVGGGATLPRMAHSANGAQDGAQSTLDSGRLLGGQGIRVNYFREFGSSRQLDRFTGQWAQPGEEIPPERRASELIHLVDQKDPRGPYGVPRWVCVMPSVLGMRRAEEQNLAFFRSGGIPPLLILILGGFLGERAKDELNALLNGQNPSSKHQAAIMEVASSGRMDQANKIDVRVEQFGGARTDDAMFMGYDERCAQRIREAFRLPPLYLGDVTAHNYATSRSSVLLAEAQVFSPERAEEDEQLSQRLLRALPGSEGFTFRSLAIVMDEPELQFKCVELGAKDKLLSGQGVVDALNKLCNLGLEYDEESHEREAEARREAAQALGAGLAARQPGPPKPKAKPPAKGAGEPDEDEPVKKSDVDGLVALGIDLADAMGRAPGTDLDAELQRVNALGPAARAVVHDVAVKRAFGADRDDLLRLFGCLSNLLPAAPR